MWEGGAMRWWRMAIVALLIVVGAGLVPGRVAGEAAAIGSWIQTAPPPEEAAIASARGVTVLPMGGCC